MNILIIEDEIFAQKEIERLLSIYFPQVKVVERLTSVARSIAWLTEHSQTIDFIISDVELSDGNCFEIYHKVNIGKPIIFTTAYNEYAVKAFKVEGVDYLLKPLDEQEFILAISKCLKRLTLSQLSQNTHSQIKNEYRSRFTIKLGDKIIVVPISDVAFFYSEDKATFVITKTNKRYILEHSLDTIEREVDPILFFRLSRNAITSISAIQSITKHFNSRLKVVLNPPAIEYILVSRLRTNDFTKWLDGK